MLQSAQREGGQSIKWKLLKCGRETGKRGREGGREGGRRGEGGGRRVEGRVEGGRVEGGREGVEGGRREGRIKERTDKKNWGGRYKKERGGI